MIALSTCWVPPEVGNLRELFELALGLGFRHFEIGVSRLPFNLAEVQKARRELGIEIASLHNVVSETPNESRNNRGDFLSLLEEPSRRFGVDRLLDTIRNCRALDARAVVVHAGSVREVRHKPSLQAQDSLADHVLAHGHDQKAREMAEEMQRWRQAEAGPYLEAAIKSLIEASSAEPDVMLGLESRFFFNEIPTVDELAVLFERLDDGKFGYWHDVGHAQIDELLGMARHEEWLERYGDRLIGIHLHDMAGKHEHRPVCAGDIDFKMVAKYIRPETIKVLELNPKLTHAEIADSLKRLQDMGIE